MDNFISPRANIGPYCKIGRFVIIEEDVTIGAYCVIGDYVKLKPGTTIGKCCVLQDYVNTSGYCIIGDGVTIKRQTMIGQATCIGDNVWVGSNVCTTRIKYPTKSNKEQWIVIERDSMIGSRALILAGTIIRKNAVIGAGSIVTKNCEEHGVYIGCPATLRRYT